MTDAASASAASLRAFDPRALAILLFALCGFENVASVAILTGGYSAVGQERRAEVGRYSLRGVLAATLSNLMSATIAGMFITLN